MKRRVPWIAAAVVALGNVQRPQNGILSRVDHLVYATPDLNVGIERIEPGRKFGTARRPFAPFDIIQRIGSQVLHQETGDANRQQLPEPAGRQGGQQSIHGEGAVRSGRPSSGRRCAHCGAKHLIEPGERPRVRWMAAAA